MPLNFLRAHTPARVLVIVFGVNVATLRRLKMSRDKYILILVSLGGMLSAIAYIVVTVRGVL